LVEGMDGIVFFRIFVSTNQNYIMRNSSRRGQRTQRSTSTTNTNDGYTTVAKNIYRDGSSYRARVSVNGIRYSRNCRTKREAIQWRNEMVGSR